MRHETIRNDTENAQTGLNELTIILLHLTLKQCIFNFWTLRTRSSWILSCIIPNIPRNLLCSLCCVLPGVCFIMILPLYHPNHVVKGCLAWGAVSDLRRLALRYFTSMYSACKQGGRHSAWWECRCKHLQTQTLWNYWLAMRQYSMIYGLGWNLSHRLHLLESSYSNRMWIL